MSELRSQYWRRRDIRHDRHNRHRPSTYLLISIHQYYLLPGISVYLSHSNNPYSRITTLPGFFSSSQPWRDCSCTKCSDLFIQIVLFLTPHSRLHVFSNVDSMPDRATVEVRGIPRARIPKIKVRIHPQASSIPAHHHQQKGKVQVEGLQRKGLRATIQIKARAVVVRVPAAEVMAHGRGSTNIMPQKRIHRATKSKHITRKWRGDMIAPMRRARIRKMIRCIKGIGVVSYWCLRSMMRLTNADTV